MTNRPANKRNPAPKIWPALVWKRDRYEPGTKTTHLNLGAKLISLTVYPTFVAIGRYHCTNHDGTPESIRAAAMKATETLKPEWRDLALAALIAAEGAP